MPFLDERSNREKVCVCVSVYLCVSVCILVYLCVCVFVCASGSSQ